MIKLGATDLRDYKPTAEELRKIKRHAVYIVCDNILDTYNIGAIFRLADAASVAGVYLVGNTGIPTDPKVGHKIHKASVGVWQWVPWKHTETVKEAIKDIREKLSSSGYQIQHAKLNITAIEQSPKSIPYTNAHYSLPLVLILGHETEGVSREGLEAADQIVEIPMFGVNKSMNVMVSLAIVLWEVLKHVE
jgi:tRNA G18 (ribose-2'-O)-methylase SpoU